MRASVSTDRKTGELGSLYVQLSAAKVAKTVAAQDSEDPTVLVDLDRNNELVGFEVLSAKMLKAFCDLLARGLPSPYRAQAQELCEKR